MDQNALQVELDQARETMRLGLEASYLRVCDLWEPQVVAALGDAAPKAVAEVARVAEEASEGGGVWQPLWWRHRLEEAVPGVFAAAAGEAGRLLEELAAQEGRAAAGAMTLEGLAGRSLAWGPQGPGQAWAARQAGAGHLRQVVARAGRRFMDEALALLGRALAGEERLVLRKELTAMAGAWQGRLSTLGRTAVHAAASRAQRAAMESLRA